MRALVFDRFGGPEVLSIRELPDPLPGPGEALVRTRAIGLNFADVYRRKGNYHLVGAPPYVAGYEAAGVVEAVGGTGPGSGAAPVHVGDSVAFADSPLANAELVRVPFDHLIPLPGDVSFELAAALLLQGLTAQYLTRDSHRLAAGETALVHAAAGGVGLLLVQICKLLGARVLGLTSSESKAQQVRKAGADEVLLYSSDWVARAQALGVDVAFDSVGATLQQSLAAVRIGGHVVFYGMAGGDPAPVDPRFLMDSSRTLTGGDLWNWLRSREERIRRAEELFQWVREGRLHVEIGARYPLAEGAAAHAHLESRRSSGKILLLPT